MIPYLEQAAAEVEAVLYLEHPKIEILQTLISKERALDQDMKVKINLQS